MDDEFEMCIRDSLDAAHSIVANYAAPQRVVQIENDAFDAAPPCRQRDPGNILGYGGQVLIGAERFGQVPKPLVEPRTPAHPGSHRLYVVDQHVLVLAGAPAETAIDFRHRVVQGVRVLQVCLLYTSNASRH